MTSRLIAFGLDGTLTMNGRPVSSRMARHLHELLEFSEIAIITHQEFEQIERTLLIPLDLPPRFRKKIHVLACIGTHYYRYDVVKRRWVTLYSHEIAPEDRRTIADVLESTARRMKLWPEKAYGPIIEDRSSEVSYAMLGQGAPAEKRYQWAEQNIKLRQRFLRSVSQLLPDFEVRLSGTTIVEVTPTIKARRALVEKFLQMNKLGHCDLVFVGTKLGRGELYYPIRQCGVKSYEVGGPEDTLYMIKGMLAALRCQAPLTPPKSKEKGV